MSILSHETILNLCRGTPSLVENCQEENVQGSSYDISLGNKYYLYNPKKKKVKHMIGDLENEENLVIPPNELCFVISNEKINMPNNLVARVSLKTDLIKKGIMLAAQPPVDPGYEGKIYGMLYNLSNKEVCICHKDTILTLEFMKLDKPTHHLPSKHPMQNFDNLKEFIKDPAIDSSLSDLKREFRKITKSFQRFIPNILTIITAIIGIMAVLMVVLLVFGQIRFCNNEKQNQKHINGESKVEYNIKDKENKKVTKK